MPEPAPAQTPTEAHQAEVLAQLTRRRDGLAAQTKEGKERLEAARAKVRQEETTVEGLEGEFKTVSDQVEAHWTATTTTTTTTQFGVWLFRGALQGEQLLAALVSSVDWVTRGTYLWTKSSRWAANRGTLLGATPGIVEGHRTPNGALVCRWVCADVRKPELLLSVRVTRSLA